MGSEMCIRDRNSFGLSGQEISRLPLETCLTMNRSWGYTIKDLDYLNINEIIRTLVRSAGKGANLLLNVGPQPNGEIPEAALERLSQLGEWMRTFGPTIRPTDAAEFGEQAWGVATRKGNKLYLHVLDSSSDSIVVPIQKKSVKSGVVFADRTPISITKHPEGICIDLTSVRAAGEVADFVIELTTKQ